MPEKMKSKKLDICISFTGMKSRIILAALREKKYYGLGELWGPGTDSAFVQFEYSLWHSQLMDPDKYNCTNPY